ncbi:MAG: glycosyltransferase family 4 protein [Bacteroidetes bacterium]|nr:glycosyltransferase family 4 protein [Bacteroidota bacterium]
MVQSQQILIIGTVWPEPNSSAAGSRTLQLIELFQKQNYKITFASASSDSEYAFDVQTLGIEKVKIELNNKSFDEFILKLHPSIVIFDRFMIEEQFGWRVAENAPDALRVLDTIDLHCLRQARQLAFKEKRPFTTEDLFSDTAKREIASILRSDTSLIISDFEMKLLQDYFKVDLSLLHYVPFLLNKIDEVTQKKWPLFEERNHFITIGNFIHEPNWNAVQYLKEEIWPLIRKQLPGAQLNVYGAYASQKVNELNNVKEGFMIKGRAEDAMQVVKEAKVCLAPLRFGAGIKGKLVEAMQCGTPSVTTEIGAEGMHGSFEWNGIVANTPQEFAAAAVKLYTEKALWQKSQDNGIKIINNFYSKEFHGAKLIEQILFLQKNLQQHRLKNFTGAMLMHHTLGSTKYMSKWIEEKGKKKLSN